MKVYLQKESFVVVVEKLKYAIKINENNNLELSQLDKDKFCKTSMISFLNRCHRVNIVINEKEIYINDACFYFDDQHLICTWFNKLQKIQKFRKIPILPKLQENYAYEIVESCEDLPNCAKIVEYLESDPEQYKIKYPKNAPEMKVWLKLQELKQKSSFYLNTDS